MPCFGLRRIPVEGTALHADRSLLCTERSGNVGTVVTGTLAQNLSAHRLVPREPASAPLHTYLPLARTSNCIRRSSCGANDIFRFPARSNTDKPSEFLTERSAPRSISSWTAASVFSWGIMRAWFTASRSAVEPNRVLASMCAPAATSGIAVRLFSCSSNGGTVLTRGPRGDHFGSLPGRRRPRDLAVCQVRNEDFRVARQSFTSGVRRRK
jgi:hypothetical protein